MDDGSTRRSRALLVVLVVTALALGAAAVFTALGVVATSKANDTNDHAERLRDRRRALAAEQRDINEQRSELADLSLDAQVDLNELSGASGYFREAHDLAAVAQYGATLLTVLEPAEGTAAFVTEIPPRVEELARRRDALRDATEDADSTSAAVTEALGP